MDGGKWKNEKGFWVEYMNGIRMLCDALGMLDIVGWAEKNPGLWGNECGGEMFRHLEAYNEAPGLDDMPRLLAHWRGVADRVEEWTRRGREERTEA